MKPHKYIISALCVAILCLVCAWAACADTTAVNAGAGKFQVEQIYVNVPEMDVFFYAQDADGNSYTPTVVQAAGLELTVGDHALDTGSVGQAESSLCYLVGIDNSSEMDAADFRQLRGAVWQLIRDKRPNDQIALYTLAGKVTCVQAATTDSQALYQALAEVTQASGNLDMAAAATKVVSDIQQDYQAMAPRKAVFLCTEGQRIITNPALLAGLLSDLSGKFNLSLYTFVGSGKPESLSVLDTLSNGRIVSCRMEDMDEAMAEKVAMFSTALELRTEVPDSMYGERQELVTLSIPSLGSAVQSTSTVYMGFRMERPQATRVEVLDRHTLRLTMNQAINANATRPQFYQVVTNDIWNWRVPVRKVEISENGRTVLLTTDTLYKGNYHVSLNKVSSRISPANVSSLREQKDFTIAVWPRDNGFYLARFRTPLLVGAVVLALLYWQWRRLRHRDRAAEQEAEAEHLLGGTEPVGTLPRRWVTLFWGQRGSIAESRWAGMVESSLMLGSDAGQCDLCLPDGKIHPQHCALCVRGESLLVQTLSPDAPVFVNGERIDGEHRLQNNDTLRLGRTTIRLVL